MKVVIRVTAGPAAGQAFTFEQPDCFLFGRAKDARVSLAADPYVSRQHFLLEISPANCRITDLDSKHGTVVNGIQYGGRKPPDAGIRKGPPGVSSLSLKHNDEIVVGDTRMKVQIEPEPSGEPEPSDSNTETGSRSTNDPAGSTGVPAGGPAEQPTQRMDKGAGTQQTLQEVQRARADTIDDEAGLKTQIDPGPAAAGFAAGGRRDAGAPSVQPEPAPNAPTMGNVTGGGEFEIPGYHLQGVLGQGGMGKVFKAIELRTSRTVAIKALIPTLTVTFHNYRAFHREIEVSRQLSHPHVVAVLGAGKTKGAYYCVLEFVKGMDLRAYVKSRGGSLSLAELAPLMMGTLEGLAYAHRKQIVMQTAGKSSVYTGIVHRDLKPENILLAAEGDALIPKVADFGLSKSYESAGMTDMTMAGVAGTPAYWPREQITHYRYLHPATDVFSIAAVFYEILVGGWARPGLQKMLDQCRLHGMMPGLPQYIRVISENPIVPIRSRLASVPQPVADVLDRALRETEVPVDETQMRRILADLRYRDAGDFRDALAKALRACGIQV